MPETENTVESINIALEEESEIAQETDEGEEEIIVGAAPVTLPNVGACVGVLYESTSYDKDFCIKNSGKIFCVHNGKYVGHGGKGSILVNHDCINCGKNGGIAETRIFKKTGACKYINVEKTPDIKKGAPHYFANARKADKTKWIVPGECVAIRNIENNIPGIHNGRFVYWTDTDGKYHGKLPRYSIPKNLSRVWYFHFGPPVAVGKLAALVRQKNPTFKTGVTAVIPLSSKPVEIPPKPACK